MGAKAASRETVAVQRICRSARTAITGALRVWLRIAETFGDKAKGLKTRRPMIGRQTGFALQAADEIQRIGNSAPDAGQEDGAALAIADDEPIDIGVQRARKFSLVLARDVPRRRQNGYMEMDLFQLSEP